MSCLLLSLLGILYYKGAGFIIRNWGGGVKGLYRENIKIDLTGSIIIF